MTDEQLQSLPQAPEAKPWWASRTMRINGLVLALLAAEEHLNVLQPMLPVNIYSLVAFGLPVVNAALRVITTTGVKL